jgi:hypothetical protein
LFADEYCMVVVDVATMLMLVMLDGPDDDSWLKIDDLRMMRLMRL